MHQGWLVSVLQLVLLRPLVRPWEVCCLLLRSQNERKRPEKSERHRMPQRLANASNLFEPVASDELSEKHISPIRSYRPVFAN